MLAIDRGPLSAFGESRAKSGEPPSQPADGRRILRVASRRQLRKMGGEVGRERPLRPSGNWIPWRGRGRVKNRSRWEAHQKLVPLRSKQNRCQRRTRCRQRDRTDRHSSSPNRFLWWSWKVSWCSMQFARMRRARPLLPVRPPAPPWAPALQWQETLRLTSHSLDTRESLW